MGALPKIQQKGKLEFTLPFTNGFFSYHARHVEYLSDQEYTWFGRGKGIDDQAVKTNKLLVSH